MIKLAEFGQSRKIAELSNDNDPRIIIKASKDPKDILRVLPYVDPQLYFKDQTNDYGIKYKENKKSEVYSVGVLLWEISSGRKPFESYNSKHHDLKLLMLKILNGKREIPIS